MIFTLAVVGAALVAAPVVQCPDGSPPPCRGRATREAPASVAVLYFENLSRDTTDLYLADGLTEELTSRLGSVDRLRVTGRSVVRRAQQAASGDPIAVGRALNVRYLVEGSLRRAGSRVRVSARLLRASDGVRVWGDDYDRTMDDLLAMQVDIANEVARNVAGQLLPGEQRSLASRPTANAAAYDHYLRSRYLVLRRTDASITQALAELDQALRIDSSFGLAEARRAQALVTAFGYGVAIASPESLAAMARRSATRAMRLDREGSETWIALGMTHHWFPPYSMAEARAALERAAQLDPRNADAHHVLGVVLMSVPDNAAAAAAFRRALALEPARAISLLDLAEIEYAERRYPAARRLVDSAYALEPQQARIALFRAFVRLRLGDVTGAAEDAANGYALARGSIRNMALAAVALVDIARGDSAAARRRLEEFSRLPLEASTLSAVLVGLGRHDEALAALERGPLAPIDRNWMPRSEFDAIRSSPRFAAAWARWAPSGARAP